MKKFDETRLAESVITDRSKRFCTELHRLAPGQINDARRACIFHPRTRSRAIFRRNRGSYLENDTSDADLHRENLTGERIVY